METLIPSAAALAFPLAALSLKRGIDLSRNPFGITLVSNLAVAFVFLPLFLWESPAVPFADAWQPLISALLFMIAQVAALKSFQGDLSIAVPMQGAKVMLVAFLATAILGQSFGARVWIAAGLSVAAIYLLQDAGGKDHRTGRRGWATPVLAFLAALAFAAFDLTAQEWGPKWGAQRFGAWVFLIQGLISGLLFMFPGSRAFSHPPGTIKWGAIGAFGMAAITLALVLAIGTMGNATRMNLLFNTRCVWSVVFVWLFGKAFGDREADNGRRIMARRLGGAGAMLVAVFMALL